MIREIETVMARFQNLLVDGDFFVEVVPATLQKSLIETVLTSQYTKVR